MIKAKNIKEASKYLSLFAKVLSNYSYPSVNSSIEDMYLPYKTWYFNLDGYDVCVYMNEFQVDKSIIQNMQIFPKKLYCLPFHVIFKTVVAFMGTEELVSFSIIRGGHVVSCWTRIKNAEEDSTVTVKTNIQRDNYLGISYGVLE